MELHALLERAFLIALTDPQGVEELRREAEQALPELEALGDDLGLAKAWRRIADVNWLRGRWNEQERALERAIAHAERAGDAREAAGALMRLPMAICTARPGSRRPCAAAGDPRACRQRAHGAGDRARCLRGAAGNGGPVRRSARAHCPRAGDRRGARFSGLAGRVLARGRRRRAPGRRPSAAEGELRRGYEALEGMGERGLLSRVSAELARTLEVQGMRDEAEECAGASEELAASADAAARISLGAVRAQILAREGRLDDAEKRAREAVGLAERTDDLNAQGRVLVDLADVLELAGRSAEAVPLLERALKAFEGKGNVVSAEKVQARLAR